MKRLVLIGFTLSLFFGAVLNSFSQAINTNIDRSTIKNYKLSNGRHLVKLKVSNSKSFDVSLSVPDIKLGEKVPLIIALHWAGGPNTYKEYSECLAFPALEFMNAVIVAPSDHGLHWVDEQNEYKLLKLIGAIKKHWPVDQTRIIITGYSNGGIGSWYYTEKYPEIFSLAIPMSGSYNAAKISVPLYVIHGKKDELFNTIKVQNIVTQSITKGSEIHLTLLENHSHYMACAYTETLHKVAKKAEKDVFEY